MATVTCKTSVRFKRFTAGGIRILSGVYRCATSCGDVQTVVITSAHDGTHVPTSRHYTDDALDVRVHNFPTQAAIQRFAKALRAELGPAFTVLYESAGTPNAHLHLQVKTGTTYTETI